MIILEVEGLVARFRVYITEVHRFGGFVLGTGILRLILSLFNCHSHILKVLPVK